MTSKAVSRAHSKTIPTKNGSALQTIALHFKHFPDHDKQSHYGRQNNYIGNFPNHDKQSINDFPDHELNITI